jgi:protoporphyrinogen oxidase
MTRSEPITILGAGISGLSVSYHLGHERCVIFEQHAAAGGHARSEQQFGFTFDQGPHISFTKHPYVRDLFRRSVGENLREFSVRVRNYFHGAWIEHPAQVHLWQIPEPLRTQCYLEMVAAVEANDQPSPKDYRQWLQAAFGPTFTATFPATYSRKYWTTDPSQLSVDWVGERILMPNRRQLDEGLRPGTVQSAHYIQTVRYPTSGGFQSFLKELSCGANVRLARSVVSIDLERRRLWFSDGSCHDFGRLASTLPLTAFVNCCRNVPDAVREAAAALDCTQLLLVNVCVPRPSPIEGHWFYVYDENKLATRIHLSERLSPQNAPSGHSAIQVECYFGRERPYPASPERLAARVAGELAEMGFIDEGLLARGELEVYWRWVPYANIVFTHARPAALGCIFGWLERFGLAREPDDLAPATDWSTAPGDCVRPGTLMLAGRFAQWKYYWTDDCVLRGRQLAGADC